MARITLLNTQVDNLTMTEALEQIDNMIVEGKPSYVVTPNVNHIVLLEKDEEFKALYDKADLILTDGQPLIWISRWKKNPIVEKVSGSDLFPKVCELAAQKGHSLYILGAGEGVAEEAAKKMQEQYSGLKIAGVYSPAFGFENQPETVREIMAHIQAAKPDVLAVSLGSPKAEKFIYRYLNEMQVPVSMSIGAAVDFAAGNVKRAPQWMSRCGLEWLYRVMREPKRLAKRYIVDGFSMISVLIKYRKVR